MKSILIVAFLIGLSALNVSAEQVHYTTCPKDPTPNCNIENVRISPCPEAATNEPCKIKRGTSANIEFDYTTDVEIAKPTVKAFWTTESIDLEFVGMENDACKFTTCPIPTKTKQPFSYSLDISKKFPTRIFDVKWKVMDDESLVCCMIFKIKLVR